MEASPTTELFSRARDIPLTELSPEWDKIPTSKNVRYLAEENYQGFIPL